jgi:hypothetical protein
MLFDSVAIGSKYVLSNATVTFVNAEDVTSLATVDFSPVETVAPAAKRCVVAMGLMMLAIADKIREESPFRHSAPYWQLKAIFLYSDTRR